MNYIKNYEFSNVIPNNFFQDGTIEMGIPSTQLYPIHHLDGQECFPGDFVVSGVASIEETQQVIFIYTLLTPTFTCQQNILSYFAQIAWKNPIVIEILLISGKVEDRRALDRTSVR